MKRLYIILLALISFLGHSQGKNTVVEYNLVIQKEEGLFDNNADLKGMLQKAMSECDKLTFQLIITENGSKFLVKENLESDINKHVKMFTLAMSHYSGMIYNLKDKLLVQKELLGENIYGKEELKKDWILSNETKMIDNYLCYKATNIYRVTYGDKAFNHAVTAWYCPKLPYPYGPIGYGNLPGLILELQVRNAVFGAKSIKLKSDEDFDIKSLEKIKVLSEKELADAYTKSNGF
ncbi:GLPGLI family protein [Flavobacterium johnsoniae]|uniref:GLPGLI family protein n=1 Tax=Flavobacterium johnsoniae TaxID=986 RepID=UPI0025AF3D8B|nr:GLPGLI family protein [Flavobacterium johnsoniae]WJS93693.1 GLPGLI family protein [Flavobacterium johnsoniae]